MRMTHQGELAGFQEYLVSHKRVSQKYAPYFELWVKQFLDFIDQNQEIEAQELKDPFLEHLSALDNIEPWQVTQAKTALELYMNHFIKSPPHQAGGPFQGHRAMLNVNPDLLKLTTQTRELIRVKHYAYSTERTYLDWLRRFCDYIVNERKKDFSPERLGAEDIKDFLSFLAINKKVSASSQNQAFNALLFVFREVLNRDLKDLAKTVRAKRGPKLPVVLSKEEIQKLFACSKGRERLLIQLLYGTGMRLMEASRLRVQDIDFDMNAIFIRASKQDKDRTTILPRMIKEDLKEHLKGVKGIHQKDLEAGYGEVFLPDSLDRKYPQAAKEWGWQYVFPAANLSVDPRSGKIRRHHIHSNTIQKMVKRITHEAGIIKNASVHTLRHSFATHLLMNGVNIREIQELLGHKNVETTMIYTHVLRDMSNAPISPLDHLYEKD